MSTQKQPKKLSEFILERNPDIDLKKAKEIISIYEDYKFYMRGGKDGRSYFCDICQKPISIEEASITKPTNFNYVCKEHSAFIDYFDIHSVRRQLGITELHLFDL
jgi:hypothetical protein